MDGCRPTGENMGGALLAPDQTGNSHVDALSDFPRAESTVAAINPWTFSQEGGQFGLINIDLGGAADSDLERKILKTVGSYGRQLGRLGDALEVILRHVKLEDLSSDEQDVLKVLEGQLAQVRQAKADQRSSATPKPSSETQTQAT
jgi:hypothetical protein